MQARAILYPKSKINIIGAVGRQSCESFETMENIIKNNVKSLVRNNTVVFDEVAKSKADTDGFTHDMKKGNNVKFLNGSEILAVVGSAKNVVGKRSNMLCFDESGIISQELFNLVEPFATQSSDFKTGTSYDPDVYPEDMPNLRLYVGSATDTNSPFYAKYREACKQMMIGNTKYFVADLNCEMPLHPTMNGLPIKPLLTQDVIDAKMRENEISAYREYYNIFDRFDQEDAVVSRSDIAQFTENYIPVRWGGKKHKYVISYDPASKVDNAPVLVTEIIKPAHPDERVKGKLIHMENLIHSYGDGVKKPMTLEEQVKRIRELVYFYNGKDSVAPYENVMLLVDAGTGGQAPAIAQQLCQDWTDDQGHRHPGFVDEDSPDMVRWAENCPHAVKGCMKLVEPRKYRTEAFDDARLLVPMGDIIFAPDAPKAGNILMVPNDKGEETPQNLSKAEIESLIQMHMMQDEICAIVRSKSKTTGTITYGLPPEKARKMHDDRAYVFVLCCWWIKQCQDEDLTGPDKEWIFLRC